MTEIKVQDIYVHHSSPNGSKYEIIKITDEHVIVYWNYGGNEDIAKLQKDLFLKYYHRPKVTKWINVYKTVNGSYETGVVFDTEEAAKTAGREYKIQTVKLELEE